MATATLTTTGRGLYGQNEGNESRATGEWVEDRIAENWLVEGEWLSPMIAAARKGNMKEMGRLRGQDEGSLYRRWRRFRPRAGKGGHGSAASDGQAANLRTNKPSGV